MSRFFGLGNVHTPEELEKLREQEEVFIKDKDNISNIPTLKNYERQRKHSNISKRFSETTI